MELKVWAGTLEATFNTIEEKREYLKGEYAHTDKELTALWKAITPEDRAMAHKALLAVRREYYNLHYKAKPKAELKDQPGAA